MEEATGYAPCSRADVLHVPSLRFIDLDKPVLCACHVLLAERSLILRNRTIISGDLVHTRVSPLIDFNRGVKVNMSLLKFGQGESPSSTCSGDHDAESD